ncbi:hypothetical protein V7O66_03510 [Methanolobus sp. ZRKC3]|uniref:hypothetical protein n=1 Tax=Methanolobus sp. ZRKC3 TaxID=3125786 RepID=UPI00324F007E
MLPLGFGKKHNVGVKQALESDVLISFLTNREYDWPKNNLKIVHQGEVVGEDVSDPGEINRLKQSEENILCGNIVIYKEKFKKVQYSCEPPLMVISAKPCLEIEEISFVSEAMIASPSRLTDEYVKSKINFKNTACIGSFLVGLNLEDSLIEEGKN